MNYHWKNREGELSKYTNFDDDLHIEFTATALKGQVLEVQRYNKNRPKTNDDMYIEAFAEIASRWRLVGKDIQPHDADRAYLEALIRVELNIPGNQEGNFSLFPHIRIPSERSLPIPPIEILAAYREFDEQYFSEFLPVCVWKGDWNKYIWKECRIEDKVIMAGTPWVRYSTETVPVGIQQPLSLKYLILRTLSFYNQAFAGDENGPTNVHSMSNLYPEKIPKMLGKLGQSTKYVTDPMRAIRHLFPQAIKSHINAMGSAKFLGTQQWNYEKELDHAIWKVRKHTSAGIRAGPRVGMDIGGHRHVYSTCGKKLEQLEYVREQINITKDEILRDPNYIPQDVACVIVPKDEMKSKAGMTPEDAKDEDTKCRAYYIPSVFQYIMACMIMGFRQLIERGHVIKVGINFWWGGATALAMQMLYNSPEMVFEDGDFKALDTTIHLMLLMMYVHSARMYYNVGSMDASTRTIFEAFFRICAERLSIKVTHMFATLWRVVYGGMPSGAFETSHGDSWVVSFLYYLYVEWVIENNPHRKNLILKIYRLRYAGIIVYGDDHVLYTHRSIHDIINEQGFAHFVKYYFNMQIRNIHQAPFITRVHPTAGVIITPGIVFLKRYFINASSVFTPAEMIFYKITSPVLPFRPIHALTNKYAYGKGDTKSKIEYMISAIGMAYDTQGTNKAGYRFCELMYKRLRQTVEEDPRKEILQHIENIRASGQDTYITRLMRTLHLSDEDILGGFPNWEDLVRRHTYDSVTCKFGGMGLNPEMQGISW